MAGKGAPLQPPSPQQPRSEDLVIDVHGNQRTRTTAAMLYNREVLEQAVALQEDWINRCVATLEAMRMNINRMETALGIIYMGVATPTDVATAGETQASRVTNRPRARPCSREPIRRQPQRRSTWMRANKIQPLMSRGSPRPTSGAQSSCPTGNQVRYLSSRRFRSSSQPPAKGTRRS